MQSKSWYASKSIWTSVAALIVAILVAIGLEIDQHSIEVILFAILGLLGISLRQAIG